MRFCLHKTLLCARPTTPARSAAQALAPRSVHASSSPTAVSKMAETACVTGASGYIATELVKQLLEKGYNVRATLRNPSDEAKARPLLALAEALPGARGGWAAGATALL